MLTANVMHCLPEVMHKPRNNQPVVFYAWTLFNDTVPQQIWLVLSSAFLQAWDWHCQSANSGRVSSFWRPDSHNCSQPESSGCVIVHRPESYRNIHCLKSKPYLAGIKHLWGRCRTFPPRITYANVMSTRCTPEGILTLNSPFSPRTITSDILPLRVLTK